MDGAQHLADFRFTESDILPLLGTASATTLAEWPNDQRHGLAYKSFRFRCTFGKSRGKPRAVLRLLPEKIPSVDELRIPKRVAQAAMTARRGIILVCGETGSGKSTTMASLLQARAKQREHIITLEDPIEYQPKGEMPLQFFHREVGRGKDVETFALGLTSALAQAPRIIMVGEINDPITAVTAINAANTGHLVFSTLHTGRVSASCASLMKWIPEDRLANAQYVFPSVMVAIVCQRLVPTGRGTRIAIHEVLMPSQGVTALISRADYRGLDSEVEQGGGANGPGHQTFKQSVMAAYADGLFDAQQRDNLLSSYIA